MIRLAARSPFTFQPHADLHLEMHPPWQGWSDIPVMSPHLALLGDIGVAASRDPTYFDFIRYQATRFKHVFVTLGNHEFYRGIVMDVVKRCENECAPLDNVHLLNRSTVEIGGLRILGCTLWSQIAADLAAFVEARMNDYHLSGTITFPASISHLKPHIKTLFRRNEEFRAVRPVEPTRVADTNDWHREDIDFLETEIARAKADGKKVLVMTHHAPTLRDTSAPEHRGNPLGHAFATDLEHMMADPVVMWVYGHSHFSHDQLINGVRVLSNSRGYPGEQTGYQLDLLVEID